MSDLGQHLRQLRLDRNMTMADVMREAEVSSSYIANIETGKRGIPSPQILRKLARVYDVDYFELLMRAGDITAKDIFGEQEVDLYYYLVQNEVTYHGEKLTEKECELLIQVMDTLIEGWKGGR